MSDRKKVLQLFCGHTGFAALQLTYSAALARLLAPMGRGQVALAIVTATISAQVFERGGEISATYLGSRGVGLRAILVHKRLQVSAITSGVLAVATLYVLEGRERPFGMAICVVGIAAYTSVLLRHLLGWIVGNGRTRLAMLVRWLPPASGTALILLDLLATKRLRPTDALLYYAAAPALTFAVLLWVILRPGQSSAAQAPPSARVPATAYDSEIRQLHKAHIGIYLLYRADQLVLGALRPARELGLYAIAVNICESTQYLPTAMTSVFASRPEQDSETAWIRRASQLTLGATGVLVVLVWMLAPGFIREVYGEQYESSAHYLGPLLGAMVAFAMVRLQWGQLVARRLARPFAWATTLTSALAIPAYLALVRNFGAVGAAWGSLVAYGALAIVLSLLLHGNRGFAEGGEAAAAATRTEARLE